jgi:hypothetical protein
MHLARHIKLPMVLYIRIALREMAQLPVDGISFRLYEIDLTVLPVDEACLGAHPAPYTRVYPKYSGIVPPSIQQLW